MHVHLTTGLVVVVALALLVAVVIGGGWFVLPLPVGLLALAGYRLSGRRAALPSAAWPYTTAAGIFGLVLLFGLEEEGSYFVAVGLVGAISSAYLRPAGRTDPMA